MILSETNQNLHKKNITKNNNIRNNNTNNKMQNNSTSCSATVRSCRAWRPARPRRRTRENYYG